MQKNFLKPSKFTGQDSKMQEVRKLCLEVKFSNLLETWCTVDKKWYDIVCIFI